MTKMQSFSKAIKVESFEAFNQFKEANKVIAKAKGSKYVFLGQSFYSLCMGNLETGKPEWFKMNGRIDNPEVLEYLLSFGKILEEELEYPTWEDDMKDMDMSYYLKSLKELVGLELHISFESFSRYYGKGEAGSALSERQAKYIKDKFNYIFYK